MTQGLIHQEWFTARELSAWLGVPLQTVYQWSYHGIGPPVHKIGRHLRYRRGDIEAWLAEQRVTRSSSTDPTPERDETPAAGTPGSRSNSTISTAQHRGGRGEQ